MLELVPHPADGAIVIIGAEHDRRAGKLRGEADGVFQVALGGICRVVLEPNAPGGFCIHRAAVLQAEGHAAPVCRVRGKSVCSQPVEVVAGPHGRAPAIRTDPEVLLAEHDGAHLVGRVPPTGGIVLAEILAEPLDLPKHPLVGDVDPGRAAIRRQLCDLGAAVRKPARLAPDVNAIGVRFRHLHRRGHWNDVGEERKRAAVGRLPCAARAVGKNHGPGAAGTDLAHGNRSVGCGRIRQPVRHLGRRERGTARGAPEAVLAPDPQIAEMVPQRIHFVAERIIRRTEGFGPGDASVRRAKDLRRSIHQPLAEIPLRRAALAEQVFLPANLAGGARDLRN